MGHCKGYGFVMFEKEASAKLAVEALQRSGVQVAFAKVSRNPTEFLNRQEPDPTNLYVTSLPRELDEPKVRAQSISTVLKC